MNQAHFRFYAELNDFLPLSRREQTFTHNFTEHPSIKDTIESFGIPHTEVNLIVVNDTAVDFSYLLQEGDRCSVYPVSQSIAIAPLVPLRPQPQPQFVLDIHLGKLAGFLRMLGFDTLYRNDCHDEELAFISSSENRILLTRDIGLLKRGIVTHGYWVRETNPHRQVVEVLRRFSFAPSIKPFHRCIHCNGLLETVSKESILSEIPLKTRENHDEFRRCLSCGNIYWKGSHYHKMQDFISSVLENF